MAFAVKPGVTLLSNVKLLLKLYSIFTAVSLKLLQYSTYLLFTLKFGYEVAKHCSEPYSTSAFDDSLLHLDETQYRQRN